MNQQESASSLVADYAKSALIETDNQIMKAAYLVDAQSDPPDGMTRADAIASAAATAALAQAHSLSALVRLQAHRMVEEEQFRYQVLQILAQLRPK
ncbi:hypothetical protein BST36_20515 [Mycolicibacterium moriokaense]|uniref:Uncharacterized protein n=1 Tax=Mycolicibacterium moriokaense TaxID=39691 RepID=A0AAD1M4E3_9MYCO|nr:hypothetical protein [Mycolicibacterium moriokaense]MCV7040111.1 hypothetical protein [Mycolicibacterium moriokaense]ORB20164.1 hypothetical protein BST36_20515 [Mycolicibacterium moriokaense]BBX00122.1 hypothetical protein MMOR_10580 [Mycolicibacterium moriokaense]